ncbi:MAG: S8 family serine peptidase [Alistipes sp.]
MKKLLLFIGILAMCSCTEDATETQNGADSGSSVILNNEEGAIAGVLSIRVTPEMAEQIEASTTRAASKGTRSGVRTIDEVLSSIDATSFERVFPYDSQFEERHRAFGLHLWYTLQFGTDEELRVAAESLSKVPGVEAVQFKYAIKRPLERPAIPYDEMLHHGEATRAANNATLPMNDPKLSKQWHYSNDGKIRNGAYGGDKIYQAKVGADIDLFDAWKLCTGNKDIVVAVIDDPVQYTHPDLAANMWTNPNPTMGDKHGYNFYNKSAEIDWKSSKYDNDYREWLYSDHGTHVAGTVAAVNNNGLGVCGIAGGNNGAGGVKIMTCQIFGYGNKNIDFDAAAKAFVYAADHGALIAQCSWGYDPNTTQAMWEKMSGGLEKQSVDYFISTAGTNDPNSPLKGGLVIFAAGNSGDVYKDKQCWPGAYAPTIAVAAMGPDYLPAYYTDYGSWADITAPGGDALFGDNGQVLSTILEDPSMTFNDKRKEGYGFMQGTSMASPHVSGIAALALSYATQLGKKYSLSEFKSLLLSSVNDINQYMTGTKPYMNPSGGWSTLNLADYKLKMGSGYLDAYKMLLAVKGTPSVYVQQNATAQIALSNYFGGAAAYASFTVSMSDEVKAKLGVTGLQVVDGKLSLVCSKCGIGVVTIQTTVGETALSKEVALVVREKVASNGGWL